MKKYMVIFGAHDVTPNIEEVEIDKETEHFVYIGKDRAAKRSVYENYFDSWSEAKEALLERQKTRCDSLRLFLERANGIMGNIKGLKQK